MSFANKAHHAHLGNVLITEQCCALQEKNPDPTSCFVLHDGDIKEVTKSLVTPTKLTWVGYNG